MGQVGGGEPASRGRRAGALKPTAIRTLHEVAVAASSLSDQDRLAALVVDRARTVAGGDAAVLRWFAPASSTFRLLATSGTAVDPAGELASEAPTAMRARSGPAGR